jgi:hypothetical protein
VVIKNHKHKYISECKVFLTPHKFKRRERERKGFLKKRRKKVNMYICVHMYIENKMNKGNDDR